MLTKHLIRGSAAVLACGLAIVWAGTGAAQEPPSSEQPRGRTLRPAPDVVHTPGGVKIKQPGTGGKGAVAVSRFDTVTLNVQDADLADVLQMLSVQSQRNIVPSPKVSGRVTANLYDVTFYEALDAILAQNGAGYVERGNFIYVYTNDELKKIREAERKQVHRIFRLNYLSAQDAGIFISPLLSPSGKFTALAPVKEGIVPTVQDAGANSNASGDAVMVRDFQENVDDVARALAELDTAPAQVLVEATVLQATLSEDMALGVDMSILLDNLGEVTGNPLSIVNSMISGAFEKDNKIGRPTAAANTTVGNVSSGPGGLKIGILTHNVAVFLRALDEVTDTTILANPKVLALNRQRADVLVGKKVAYLSTTATATATTQTVNFLETGTQLTVRPFVSSDGAIRMELKPRISSATLRDASGGATGPVTVPDENTQELTTNVLVRDGQTVVLGGLFQEQTTVGRKQVPGLGDIPIAGWAFKGKDDHVERSEVIFLITPHIMKDKALAATANSALEDVDRNRVAAREKLLGFTHSKWGASHLRDALEHLEKGQRDKALYEVNKALRFDPGMPEARRLKERLMGERSYEPSRRILEEAVDMVVDNQAGRRPRTRVPVKPDPLPALPQRPEGYDPEAERYVPPAPQPVPPAPSAQSAPVTEPAPPPVTPAPPPLPAPPPPPPPAQEPEPKAQKPAESTPAEPKPGEAQPQEPQN